MNQANWHAKEAYANILKINDPKGLDSSVGEVVFEDTFSLEIVYIKEQKLQKAVRW